MHFAMPQALPKKSSIECGIALPRKDNEAKGDESHARVFLKDTRPCRQILQFSHPRSAHERDGSRIAKVDACQSLLRTARSRCCGAPECARCRPCGCRSACRASN